MPIAFLVASMRAALNDVEKAYLWRESDAFLTASGQLEALIDELEKHDSAKERIAANDNTEG